MAVHSFTHHRNTRKRSLFQFSYQSCFMALFESKHRVAHTLGTVSLISIEMDLLYIKWGLGLRLISPICFSSAYLELFYQLMQTRRGKLEKSALLKGTRSVGGLEPRVASFGGTHADHSTTAGRTLQYRNPENLLQHFPGIRNSGKFTTSNYKKGAERRQREWRRERRMRMR